MPCSSARRSPRWRCAAPASSPRSKGSRLMLSAFLAAIIAGCLLLALSACAGNNRFVMLPDEDGSVGAILVENQPGRRTLREAGAEARVTAPGAPPDTVQASFRERLVHYR